MLEAGNSVLLPLLEILHLIKKSKIPQREWNSVFISILYKNKGSLMSLVDHRGIFIASIVAKIFERVLKNRTETYMKNINFYFKLVVGPIGAHLTTHLY